MPELREELALALADGRGFDVLAVKVWACGSVAEAAELLRGIVVAARQDGIEQGRGDMERLEREWRADERRRIAEETA